MHKNVARQNFGFLVAIFVCQDQKEILYVPMRSIQMAPKTDYQFGSYIRIKCDFLEHACLQDSSEWSTQLFDF
jgi:hypothetical protein